MAGRTLITGIVFSILGVLICLLLNQPELCAGLMTGALLGAVNLIAIVWLVKRMTVTGNRPRHPVFAALIMIKFLVLATVTYFGIVRLGLNAPAFLIGYSIMLFSAIGNVILLTRSLTPKED